MRVWGNTQSLIISISSPPKEPWYLKPKITNNGEIKISNQEEKSGVQKMRELHEEIRKSLKPSKELIDALIKTGKIIQSLSYLLIYKCYQMPKSQAIRQVWLMTTHKFR